jgi:hypothetical protein
LKSADGLAALPGKKKVQSFKVKGKRIMTTSSSTPRFFGSNSEFINKEELASSGKAFCILTVEDTDTMYGQKWFLQIFVDGEEEMRTMTFAHGDPEKSKREQDFLQLAAQPEYLPVHACYLRKYNFEGKSGYRISARSGGGPCPCTTDVPQKKEAFLPDDDEEPLVSVAQPQPQQEKATMLDNAPASPKQYVAIGKLAGKLGRDVDMPETFGEAKALIEQLSQDYDRVTAQLNRRETKTEAGASLR